jgi:cell division protein ZapA
MSQVTIEIGGRSFEVVCQEGEEEYLHAAAAMLNEEAQKLDGGGARVTESRMLLMSGLLLADRTAAMEEKLKASTATASGSETTDRAREAESKLRAAEVDMAALKAQLTEAQSNVSVGNPDQDEMMEQLRVERDQAVKTLQQIVGKIQGLAAAED